MAGSCRIASNLDKCSSGARVATLTALWYARKVLQFPCCSIPRFKVPDDERAGRVKARVQEKLTNPFNAERERKRREKEEKEETEKPVWDPVIERADKVVENSFADIQAKAKPARRKLLVSPPPLFLP